MGSVSTPSKHCLKTALVRAVGSLAFVIFLVSQAFAQNPADAEKLTAYRLFHEGKTRLAAAKLKTIAASATLHERVGLERDILEVCAAGYDWRCVEDTIREMLPQIQKEPKLHFVYPDIVLYEAKRALWFEDTAYFEQALRVGGPSKIATPVPHASLYSELALVFHRHLLQQSKSSSAEELRSSAMLGLLLTEPKNTYGISKALIALIEALLDAQDIVGAYALVAVADPFLVKSVSHRSALYARYRFALGQLSSFTNMHANTVATLADAARLYEQLEIDESVKLHQLALANSLASAAFVLDGKLAEAQALHAQHPLQPAREALLRRGKFETSTEFFFGVSDVFLTAVIAKEGLDSRWSLLFEELPEWRMSSVERLSFDSYRTFALGLLSVSDGRKEANLELLLSAAKQRLSLFDTFRQGSENFSLPSLVDRIVIAVGLTAALRKGDADSVDVILGGSEVLARNLRHHLVDIGVLLASQPNSESRRRAHAFVHLLAKKREWELEKVRKLLANDNIVELRGAILENYGKAISKISELKTKIDFNNLQQGSVALLKRLQQSLQGNQAYVGYFPHVSGIGKLCVTSESWKLATAPYDASILRDVDIVAAAVKEFPRSEQEAAQFPAKEAVRIYQFLFGGLEECLPKGTHVTVALPLEFASVPLAALLRGENEALDGKVNLGAAQWLVKDLSFSITLSAQHHLATISNPSREAVRRRFLGVGDPLLEGDRREALGAAKLFRASLKTPHGLLDFAPLPETADEVKEAGTLFAADKSDILLGESGTEEAFRKRPLGEYDVIHFATHGLVSSDIPGLSDSALVLTPKSTSDTYDDGLLSATEISRLSLNARLVILSACNTAKYDIAQATRGVQDLQAAFTVAGAPTLVASLWPVDSLATKTLIIGFLRNWQSAPIRAADALALTMRSYIDKSDNLHRHPSFWAPFVIAGNGGVVGTQDLRTSNRAPELEFLSEFSDGGEIYHVTEVGSDALVTMIGEWNGAKMNGITSRRVLGGAEKWRLASREIGSGRAAVTADQIYAAGYTTNSQPTPVIRGISLDGKLRWKSEFSDLVGYMFSDLTASGSDAVVVAYPHLVPQEKNHDIFVLTVSKDGTLKTKTKIGTRPPKIDIGTVALITHWNDRFAVVTNSGLTSKLKSDRKTVAGLPTICWEGAKSTVYELDREHRVLSTRVINDFRANSIVALDGSLFVGGDSLNSCWIHGAAAVVQIDRLGKPQRIWSDDDVFATSVRGISRLGRELIVVIGHERSLGMPGDTQSPVQDYSYKRWSEDVATAREASIVRLSRNGKFIDRRYIAVGFGMYLVGTAEVKGRTVTYGSMGGIPTFATLAVSPRPKRQRDGSTTKPANSTWHTEVFANHP